MKKNNLVLSILLLFFFICTQNSVLATQNNNAIPPSTFEKAIELYNSANYIAAERLFNDLLEETSTNDPARFDIDYYRLMCYVKQNKAASESEISAYLNNHPENPRANQLQYELAKLQFTNRRYPLAVRSFNNVKPEQLNENDRDDFHFFKAYSNFEAGNTNQASQGFFEIKQGRSRYAPSSSYYWGYINYLEGNYNTALEEFSKLQNNREFHNFIQYYTIQIYYLQERYENVTAMGDDLLVSAPADQKNELYKIIGDSYYLMGKYIAAIKYLESYQGINGRKTAEDFFKLGYCYYHMKDYPKAIDAFEKATVGKNQLTQLAYYHLADCYLQNDEKNKARIAFEQASKFDFDSQIEENALFNYAKLTYELSYSPFNETIKAFDQYIAKYPDSERNDAAFDYLVKVYMTTRNYRDAISSIENIKNQSPAIREALQRVTYYRALELLNDGYYTGALEMFNKSLQNSTYNRTIRAQSLYWSAETNYRLAQYERAIERYTEFQSSPGAFSLPVFSKAYYNVGYSYFNLENYPEAISWFRKYLNQSKKEDRIEADAANRIGDAYFINRQYSAAIEFYSIARDLNTYDADYSIFQIALCHGLNRDFDEKIESLQTLVNQYPRSPFIEDAIFETARTYERNGNMPLAISHYEKLIQEMPQSSRNARAYLQLGLIYFNQSNFTASLANYKKVVEHFPNSEEAQAALVGIQNNYVDMGNVDEYFAYVENLDSHIAVSADEQESVYYMAAEKNYMERNPTAGDMMKEYLKRYPNGLYRNNALFYLAETHYDKGEYSTSLTIYQELLERPDNIFTEQALIKASELLFNTEKYDESLRKFLKLEKIAGTRWTQLRARLGIMRCNYALSKPAETVKSAITLLETDNITELMIREANYKLAKSYYLLEEETQALKYFKLLAHDVSSIEGAESKYFIAQIYFNQEKLDDCENEIMDFISKSTPHQYWLARSFILLSDVYKAKEDLFQAKHTLNSIINNYTSENDGIIETANSKIAQIEELEKQTVITNDNNE